MLGPRTYTISQIKDETVAALTALTIDGQYPKVTFEAVDTGCGYYDLRVWRNVPPLNYGDYIDEHTLKMFKSNALEIVGVLVHTVYEAKKLGLQIVLK